jgi:hypothetical protein
VCARVSEAGSNYSTALTLSPLSQLLPLLLLLTIFVYQQRLEQLVVVHRQLLRRFGQVELENGECRKKLALRDKHIAHLEATAKTLNTAMRAQGVSEHLVLLLISF